MRYRQALVIRPVTNTLTTIWAFYFTDTDGSGSYAAYRKAIEFEPGECKYYSNLGNVIAKSWVDSTRQSTSIAKQSPFNPTFLLRIMASALRCSASARWTKPSRCYMRALDCDTNNREARINLVSPMPIKAKL